MPNEEMELDQLDNFRRGTDDEEHCRRSSQAFKAKRPNNARIQSFNKGEKSDMKKDQLAIDISNGVANIKNFGKVNNPVITKAKSYADNKFVDTVKNRRDSQRMDQLMNMADLR